MATYSILPYQAAGPVSFGMSREQVRTSIESPCSSFRRTPESSTEIDAFNELDIFVCYDAAGKCEAVEFAAPAMPILDGRSLLGRSLREAVKSLRELDAGVEVDASGATAFEVGVGLFAPNALEDPDDKVEV